jgi:hypothetical protein
MKRVNMKFLVAVVAVLTMGFVGNASGQIFAPEGLNMPGTWNGFTNPPTNNLALASSTQVTDGRVTLITTGTRRYQTVFSVAESGADIEGGTYTWLFTSGASETPFANKWAGVNVSINTEQTYSFNTGADNSITVTNGKWYAMNWRDSGYANTSAIFIETSAEPATISSVSQSPLAASVPETHTVTVTVITNVTPAVDEYFYIWYKIGSVNSLATITFDGTTGTAEIPGQNENTKVDYRVISSSITLESGQIEDYYWMRSIRFSNEFTYTVAPPDPPVAISLVSPANASIGLLPRIEFSWTAEDAANTYDIQVASDAGFTSILNSANGLEVTSITFDVGFTASGFWRVRGVNNGGNGAWSEVRTFSTVEPKATFLANGLGGFGEPVGGSTLQFYDDGTTISGVFNKGNGDFNDRLVIYIANGATGRNQITGVGVNDRADLSRAAVSFTSNSVLSFPSGFDATYAISISQNALNLFGIPNSGDLGNNGLNFIKTVRTGGFVNTAPRFVFSFDWADLGLTSENSFRFVATYLNPAGNDNAGFVSNEGFGSGLPVANVAGGSAAFTTSYNYPSGNVTANLTFSGSQNWRFLSSPIQNATYGNLLNGLWTQGFTGSSYPSAGESNSNVRTLNGVSSVFVSVSNLTDTPAAGQGFAAGIYRDNVYGEEGTFPKVVSVSGTPNSGDISPTLNPNGQFTLVGNPYPYPIAFDLTTRSNLAPVIYVYDYVTPETTADGDVLNEGASQGVYRSYNGSVGSLGNYRIAPFQGFLVYANEDNPSLTFTNASRSGSTTFRGKESQPIAFELEILGNGLYSSTWVQFADDATVNFDSKDAMKWFPFSESFVNLQTISGEGIPLDINYFPIPTETQSIPLEIVSTTSGDFTLRTGSWNIPDMWSVIITDQQTGESWQIQANSQVTIPVDVGSTALSTHQLQLIVSPVPSTDVSGIVDMPSKVSLHQNYPNPFNPVTNIRFELPVAADVRLEIFDVTGRKIATLSNGNYASGAHTVQFDATNIGSGVYVYRLQAGGEVMIGKMTLIK